MKKASLIFILCGALAIVVLAFFAVMATNKPSVGIIGGADGPTAILISRETGHIALTTLFMGGAMLISGLLALIFNKSVAKNNSIALSATALGISASVALGIFSIFMFASCFFLSNPDKHPIKYPLSMLIGVVAFAAMIGLIYLYSRMRSKNKSLKGIIFDFSIGIIFVIPFFLAFNTFYDLLSHFGF